NWGKVFRTEAAAGCRGGGGVSWPSCGSGWFPGHESNWHSNLPYSGGRICDGRRQSSVSDSGDTGIGTYCSDSLEGRIFTDVKAVRDFNPGCWNMSRHISKQATSSVEAPSSLDMKVHQPIRRSSSFTKLSSGVDKSSTKTSSYCYSPGAEGSLDRGVLHGYRKKRRDSNINLYLPLSSTMNCSNFLSTGLKTDLPPSSSHSSPVKYSLSCSSFHETKDSGKGQQICGLHSSSWGDWPVAENPDRGMPIQPAVRTQMWLTEQMEYRPKLESGNEPGQASSPGTEDGGVNGLTLSHQELGLNQVRGDQKQQIMQLHVWIRENEHRAQQESAMTTSCKLQSDRRCCDEELSKKLAAAELEVLHLNLFFKQVTLKYTEEIRKLEEKIKTRDRYITSLKKKYQRESEQNQDKQQRIEILEKYLSDLPTLNEVQVQSKQQEKLEEKNRLLENTVFQLQKSIEEGCALIKKKDVIIEMQAKTEDEMMTSVQRLRKKVQQCLDDGARLPVQDLKNLLGENSQLLQQQDNSNMVLRIQKDEIERLTSQLMVGIFKIYMLDSFITITHNIMTVFMIYHIMLTLKHEHFILSVNQDKDKLVHLSSAGSMSGVDELLKEMSLCLLDLRGFCSILAQRAQGKEPNLSLLLGMKCNVLNTNTSTSHLHMLLQVGLLKRGIDDLRRTVAEYCPQYVAPGCATQ
uniref:Centrosomal protein 85, like n=1 Tax=Poecilia mexicana TaxID=48701 RepID=A0A3B3YMI1_9TELE